MADPLATLPFGVFSATNRARCEAADGFGHPIDGWSLSDWFLAATGEFGEAANKAKKLNRVRDGLPGNTETPDELRAWLADEIADAVIYLDLAAQHEGFDLGTIVASKFNRTSERIGAPHRLVAGVTLTQPQPDAGSLRRWAVHSPFCDWTMHEPGLPCRPTGDTALLSRLDEFAPALLPDMERYQRWLRVRVDLRAALASPAPETAPTDRQTVANVGGAETASPDAKSTASDARVSREALERYDIPPTVIVCQHGHYCPADLSPHPTGDAPTDFQRECTHAWTEWARYCPRCDAVDEARPTGDTALREVRKAVVALRVDEIVGAPLGYEEGWNAATGAVLGFIEAALCSTPAAPKECSIHWDRPSTVCPDCLALAPKEANRE